MYQAWLLWWQSTWYDTMVIQVVLVPGTNNLVLVLLVHVWGTITGTSSGSGMGMVSMKEKGSALP